MALLHFNVFKAFFEDAPGETVIATQMGALEAILMAYCWKMGYKVLKRVAREHGRGYIDAFVIDEKGKARKLHLHETAAVVV